LITSSFSITYFIVIPFTPSIQYASGSNIKSVDDGDNGSSGDDSNDSSPRDGSGDEEEEEGDNDPDDTLKAREEEGEGDPDPANIDEREDLEEEEDPANIDESEEIQRPEDIPLNEDNPPSDTEDMDKEEMADRQLTCLGYYEQNVTDEVGALTVKKIFASTGELIPGGLFRVTPSPYDLDSSLLISDKENTEKLDCSPVGDGMIVLEDVPFSSYNIQEILLQQHDSPSNDFLVIHEANIYIHENLANPIINFVERDFSFTSLAAQLIPDQYIISLKDDVEDAKLVAQQFADRGAEVLHIYEAPSIFRGFAINVNENREVINEIANDSRVNYIEQDKLGRLASAAGNDMLHTNTSKEYETIPSGIDRIDADLNGILFEANDTQNGTKELGGDGNGDISYKRNPQDVNVDIAILDTGISFAHSDLNVFRGASFITDVKSADDDHGHGSHIAGTAAGKDNSLGVIGTAPGARLWAVKVCDKLGNCPVSSQIKGVEYVTEHSDEIDVVNISIENPLSLALDRTINKSIAKGVVYVAAAGNSGRNASLFSPASNPSVITVSAIADSDGKCGGIGRPTFVGPDDSFANFSNFGDAIDIAAPGVDILSAYNGTEYGVDSGTSTAAPHVAGAAALYKAAHTSASPSEVYEALLKSGSSSVTECDGNGQGYFQGDVDEFNEPLLYVDKVF
jgi:subtilisin family serine protease